MLLGFAGDWDATAIGTLLLAVAMFVSLIFARRALGQTQQQIKLGQQQLAQTQREIAPSRTEVEEAHRPVVVPLHDNRRIDFVTDEGVRTVAAQPSVSGNIGRIMLGTPIENVGTGPALNVEAAVKIAHEQPALQKLPALRVDGRLVLEIGLNDLELQKNRSGIPTHDLVVTYQDVAGKGWITRARYIGNRYEPVSVDPEP
jgi:hypothetical protein